MVLEARSETSSLETMDSFEVLLNRSVALILLLSIAGNSWSAFSSDSIFSRARLLR